MQVNLTEHCQHAAEHLTDSRSPRLSDLPAPFARRMPPTSPPSLYPSPRSLPSPHPRPWGQDTAPASRMHNAAEFSPPTRFNKGYAAVRQHTADRAYQGRLHGQARSGLCGSMSSPKGPFPLPRSGDQMPARRALSPEPEGQMESPRRRWSSFGPHFRGRSRSLSPGWQPCDWHHSPTYAEPSSMRVGGQGPLGYSPWRRSRALSPTRHAWDPEPAASFGNQVPEPRRNVATFPHRRRTQSLSPGRWSHGRVSDEGQTIQPDPAYLYGTEFYSRGIDRQCPPNLRGRSPDFRLGSLSPTGHSPLPGDHPFDPRGHSLDPRNYALRPRDHSLVFRDQSISPGDRSPFPRDHPTDPRDYPYDPMSHASMFSDQPLSPRHRSPGSVDRSFSPGAQLHTLRGRHHSESPHASHHEGSLYRASPSPEGRYASPRAHASASDTYTMAELPAQRCQQWWPVFPSPPEERPSHLLGIQSDQPTSAASRPGASHHAASRPDASHHAASRPAASHHAASHPAASPTAASRHIDFCSDASLLLASQLPNHTSHQELDPLLLSMPHSVEPDCKEPPTRQAKPDHCSPAAKRKLDIGQVANPAKGETQPAASSSSSRCPDAGTADSQEEILGSLSCTESAAWLANAPSLSPPDIKGATSCVAAKLRNGRQSQGHSTLLRRVLTKNLTSPKGIRNTSPGSEIDHASWDVSQDIADLDSHADTDTQALSNSADQECGNNACHIEQNEQAMLSAGGQALCTHGAELAIDSPMQSDPEGGFMAVSNKHMTRRIYPSGEKNEYLLSQTSVSCRAAVPRSASASMNGHICPWLDVALVAAPVQTNLACWVFSGSHVLLKSA